MQRYLLFIVSITIGLFSFAQSSLHMHFVPCELRSNDVKGIKTFEITTQKELDKYFKADTVIDFKNTLVLAGIVGSDKPGKYIRIDAVSFMSVKGNSLYVRYDLSDKKEDLFKKYVVAVIQKPEYKKVFFMKGKLYDLAISGE